MHIIKLTLKNLNSLVGTWQIDFTDSSFQDTGIFAITGQTGAGKTTILDAICLALYGETPRISSITSSSNDIMSRRTGDCLAEVVIAINEVYYRCSWSQKRAYNKPDGNLQSAQHSISRLPHPHAENGDIIEDSIRRTKDKIQALLGMHFRQFTRSIMLAQGSFSAFLQASSDERAKILEQITGTDIYADISMRVHKKKQENQQQLETLKATLGGIQLLDDAQLTELNTTMTQLHTQQSTTKTHINIINQRQQWLKDKAKLHHQLSQQQQQLTATQAQLKDFADDANRLQQAQRAFAIEGAYHHLQQMTDDHQQEQRRLTTLTQQLPDKQQALTDITQQVDKQSDHLQSLENTLTQQKPLFKEVRDLDQHIAQCQQRLNDQHEQHHKLTDNIKKERQNSEHTQHTLTQLTADIANLQAYLSQHNHQDLPHTRQQLLEQGKALSNTLQQRQNLAKEQQSLHQQYQQLSTQSEQLATQRQQLQNQEQHNQEQLAQQRQQIQQLLTDTQAVTGIVYDHDNNPLSAEDDQLSKTAPKTFLKHIAHTLAQAEQHGNQRQQQLTQIQELTQQLHTDCQQLNDNLTTLQAQQHTLTQQHSQQEQLTQELSEREQDIHDLQHTLTLYDKIHRLEEHIISLSDDEPCPLCGATEHPYLADLAHGSHPHYTPEQADAGHLTRTKDQLTERQNAQQHQQTTLTKLQTQLAVTHNQHTDKCEQRLTLLTQTKQHLKQLLTQCDKTWLTTEATDKLQALLDQHITQLQTQLEPDKQENLNKTSFLLSSELVNHDISENLAKVIDDMTQRLHDAQQQTQNQLDNIHALSKAQTQLTEDIERHFDNQLAHEQQRQQLNSDSEHIQTKFHHLQDMDKRVKQDTHRYIEQALSQCQQLMALINKPATTTTSVPTSLTQLTEQLAQLKQVITTDDDGQPTTLPAQTQTQTQCWEQCWQQPFWQQLQSEDLLQPLRDIATDWKQLIDTHTSKTQQLHDNNNQQHSLTATLTAQQTQLQAYQQEQQTLSQTISAQQAQLQTKQQERRDKLGELDPDEAEAQLQADITTQRQKLDESWQHKQQQQLLIQDLQSQLTELTQSTDKKAEQIKALQKDFTEKLSKQGFTDVSDFAQARLPTEEREQLQAQHNQLNDRIAHLNTHIDNLRSQLDELGQQVKEQDKNNEKNSLDTIEAGTIDDSDAFLQAYQQLTDTALTDAIDALNQKENQLKQQLEEQQLQLGGIEQQLKTHHDNLSKTQAQQALINKQQQENLLWDKLHALIGQADGKKYRNFVQGLTFDIMIGEANHQLNKMSDRYLLYRDDKAGSNSLELSVIDLYQGGEVRTSKNLSGGESFIISLALALGLSSMASHNMPMNSLFLDEGFGTLDEDSLEIALDTLTHLHQEGKLIGVISHIQSLKDRILTQIQVSKLSGGISKLSGAGVQRLS